MADLEVQRKKRTPWWLWLLLLLIILAVVYYFMRGRNQLATMNTGSDSTSTTQTTTSTSVSQSEWSTVDFNAPAAKYNEITDTAVRVSEAGNYAVYSLGENILFAAGQNTLQNGADARLKQVAASLNQRYKNARIGIFGRTDSTGTAGENKQLGAERAATVKNWLIKNGNVQEADISVHSLGEAQPVASNGTATGRQQNRSVEIVALRDSSKAQ